MVLQSHVRGISRSWKMRSTAVLALLLLSACQSEPSGQVAASVDGEEITLAEINAELTSMQVPEGADKKVMQQIALQRVIERKLMAGNARRDGLADTPDFIIRRQQLEDALLVQMLTQKVARTVKAPTDADVDKFMASNPQMFANRTIFTADQVRFQAPARDDYLKELTATKSLAQVIAVLDKLGIKYERQNNQIDSAQLPADMVAKVQAVPAGEPIIVPGGGVVTVSVITGKRELPVAGPEARQAASAVARNKALGDLLQGRLKQERAQAEIKYQPGFAPPAGKGAGTAAAPQKVGK